MNKFKGVVVGMVVAFAAAPAAHASTGAILEDDPRWSCVDDGNRVCGPTNAEGQPAGCYDNGGVMVAPWPCAVSIDPQTGDTDVFVPGDRNPVYVY